MGIWLRLAWVLCLAWLFTACATFPSGDLAHQTSPFLARTLIRTSDAGPLADDSGERSGVSVFPTASSTILTEMSAGAFVGSSTLRLSKNGDGSISLLSDGRPVSLLRGLDPARVNPAVLPFLFPSCDAPASPVRVFH